MNSVPEPSAPPAKIEKKIRIAFWGSPPISAQLLTLLHKHPAFEVALVFSQQDKPRSHRGRSLLPTPVKAYAQQENLPCLTPASLKKEKENIARTLRELHIDLHVILAYGKIIPQQIFLLPPLQAVNFHAGLLPLLRGASPIEAALLADMPQSGWTLQKISECMDAGDIYYQSKVAIDFFDNRESLYQKLATNLNEIAVPALLGYARAQFTAQKQEETAATYCGKITTRDGNIYWQWPAKKIRNLARALGEKTPLFSFYRLGEKNKKIRLFVNLQIPPRDLLKTESSVAAGTLAFIDKDKLWVACGDGFCLPIAHLQPEGKKSMDAKSFLNGYRLQKGSRFFSDLEKQD